MELGMCAMPLRPLEGDITANYHRDVEAFVLGDKLGYSEGWMGEHFTIPWEPVPSLMFCVLASTVAMNRSGAGTGSQNRSQASASARLAMRVEDAR